MLNEYLIPFVVSNIISLVLIFICYKWYKAGKILFSLIFLAAGIFNFTVSGDSPEVYYKLYGETAVFGFYKTFIYGFFRENVEVFVKAIALGQITVGILLLSKGTWNKLGVIGGITFLIGISPLGIGSAFPATLLMIIGLLLLFKKASTENIIEIFWKKKDE